jgi:lipid A 3-O-deacylase
MRLRGTAAAMTAALGLAGAWPPASANAAEAFVGLYGHDVTFVGDLVGLGAAGREHGVDLHLGYRTGRVDALRWIGRPQVHVFASVNSQMTSHFGGAGVNWRIPLGGKRFYLRPGMGLVYTTGKVDHPPANIPGLSLAEQDRRASLYYNRIDFGSHVLFEPELALGVDLNDRLALEASYVHLSHGQILASGKNQGLDDAGLRLVWKFGG